MKKVLREKLLSRLESEIESLWPVFERYKEKSRYIWPGEVVLRAMDSRFPRTVFVILQADPKGRDQFTVELAWSSTRDFPELMRRPSCVATESEAILARPRGAVRLFSIANPNMDDWIDVREDTIGTVVAATVDALRDSGIPYLMRLTVTE